MKSGGSASGPGGLGPSLLGKGRSAPPRVCVLSPQGRGAVAVVRVWGPGGLEIADAAFRPARGVRLADSPGGRVRFGRMGAGPGDEVVAIVTGDDPPEVEIHCHGGPAAVALVTEELVARGAERRQPAAWVRHTARSLIEAEADVDLARAPTLRTAEILLEQAQGALTREVRQLLERIPDEPGEALHGLETLRDRAAIGLRLISGWRVVLAGRPNVGKSRLLNALAGYGRAIVDATPGTTRDTVTVHIALDGWPVELTDTAGLRTSEDAIEAAGIAMARARQREADLILVAADRSEPWTEDDRALLESESTRLGATLIVANKADLPSSWEPIGPEVVTTSAERGDGIEALNLAIVRRLIALPPPPAAGVPFRPRQLRRVERAINALQAGDLSGASRHLRALLT